MGTRADFYVGRGRNAEWLGSIAWDGYPDGLPVDIVRPPDADAQPVSESDFRQSVASFLAEREDATLPEQHGWPWPWENSLTTDYSYAWDNGVVYACCFGHRWYRANDPALNDDETEAKEAIFPDMSTARHAPAGHKRSGVMLFSFRT